MICQVFLQEQPRKWSRLTLSLQIHKTSVYWTATKVSRKQAQTKQVTASSRSLQFPRSLQKRVREILSRAQHCAEDSDLMCQILDQDPVEAHDHGSCDSPYLDTNWLKRRCQGAMAFLNDLGCDQYLEDEVVQVQMLDPPSRFASYINGAMVYEFRLSSPEPSAELLYNIELLHRMKGARGIARLVGIVTDTGRKTLQGYLIEFPRARWRMDRIVREASVPWSRRLKWARQLIECVAHLHSQGLVAGMICAYRIPVILNDSDNVHFWYFRNTLVVGRNQGGYYPPEYQHLRNADPAMIESCCPRFTSKTDIFHLGLMLWTLASQKPCRRSLVCSEIDCQKGSLCNNESHSRPPRLHSLPGAIPQYYKDAMDSCVAEKPEDRPTARELLAKFPAESELYANQWGAQTVAHSFGHNDLLAQAGGILQVSTCSLCFTDHIQEAKYFHCNVCEFGDFDLCQQCYSNGKHCFDEGHFLLELEGTNRSTISGRHSSSPDSYGSRRILHC